MHHEVRTPKNDSPPPFGRKRIGSDFFNKVLSQEEWLTISTSILQLPPVNRNMQDIKVLMRATEEIQFFEKLKDELGKTMVVMCLKALQLERYAEGDIVFKQGDPGDKFFIILNGSMGVYVRDRSRASIISLKSREMIRDAVSRFRREKKQIEDESNLYDSVVVHRQAMGSSEHIKVRLALLNDAPRMATIKSLTNSTLAVLDRQEYKQILAEVHNRELEKQIHELSSVPTLKSLSRKGMQMLIYTFQQVTWKYGQFVYHENDPNDDLLYIIIDGDFKIFKSINRDDDSSSTEGLSMFRQQPRSRKVELCIIGKDSLFGEQESFEESPKREFSVQCISLLGRTYVVPLKELRRRTAISNEQHVIQFISELNQRKSRWRHLLQLKIEEVYKKCTPKHPRRRNSSYDLGQIRPVTVNNDAQLLMDRRKAVSLSSVGFSSAFHGLASPSFVTQMVDGFIHHPSKYPLFQDSSHTPIQHLASNLVNFQGDPHLQLDTPRKNVLSLKHTINVVREKSSIFKEMKNAQTQMSSIMSKERQSKHHPVKLLPQDMRALHNNQNKAVKKCTNQSLHPYMARINKKRLTQRSLHEQSAIDFMDQTIRLPTNESPKHTIVRPSTIPPPPINFDSISKTLTQRNVQSNQRTNRSEKITSRVSPNPKASQLPRCRDIQERFRDKNVNNDIDSSLIVESRIGVMSRVVKSRNKTAGGGTTSKMMDMESTVMVPCGLKHLRARNWPIKANLFVMKMKEPTQAEERSFAQVSSKLSHQIRCQREKTTLFRKYLMDKQIETKD